MTDPLCTMTPFERIVLEILSRSGEALGWYQIERRLSTISIPERPHLPGVLSRLREQGLVDEVRLTVEPLLRYVITQSGRQALGQLEDN